MGKHSHSMLSSGPLALLLTDRGVEACTLGISGDLSPWVGHIK